MGAIVRRPSVRRLTVREWMVVFWVGVAAGPWLAALAPADQDSLPVAVALWVVGTVVGAALLWLVSYALRIAAASKRAPHWLSRGMDPNRKN